jgi:S-adenosylmethionine:tRNA ribosyltransferase-isomerase
MLVVSRATGLFEHRTFADIGEYLNPGEHLVFNDTKVIPARLFGKLETASGPAIEVVLIEEVGVHQWSALGFPMRKIRAAERLFFNDRLTAEVLPSAREDRVMLRFASDNGDDIGKLLDDHGTMPIPPYIRDGRGDEQDKVDYQSIFATHPGSVAAPTASLHFTDPLLGQLRAERHVEIDRITLHVGTASFQPILVNGELRRPSAERFDVPADVLARLQAGKHRNQRVIAVGTTVVRALETAARGGERTGSAGSTELFIQPGFEFRLVDALVTNFHQPRTTHLLLVEALLGAELLDKAYRVALEQGYRFLSYGDGMLLV